MDQVTARPVAATGTVHTGPGVLFGAQLAAAAAAATLTIYDGTSAAGPVIAVLSAAIGTSAAPLVVPGGIYVKTGIHVVLTGAAAQGVIFA